MKIFKTLSGQFRQKSFRQLVANFRTEYISNGINETTLKESPIDQFEVWFNEAVSNKLIEPNVMHLSTATPEGKSSSRIMLLKGFDERGFIFYTNYDSRKGIEINQNIYAAMSFLWLKLYKQVRIEGTISRISNEESDIYFSSRPRGSQISSWVSAQSTVISDRAQLINKSKELEKRFQGMSVPRPENWGGYCLSPQKVEFWQGRANRLHDRILYSLKNDNSWSRQRLSP
ncbi:MAG: pyridoxamine 5'-phosphate oxidase [Saprospiraceae bacterium]|nr:pyridoxamine 5'-phosphate oxidase [Saprospiraceae bacterium]